MKTAIVTFASTLLVTLGISAASADTLSDVKSKGTLTIGVKSDYPPYGFLNDKGEIVGFEVDLGKYIAKDILGPEGKVELVPVVASNRIEFLNSGRIDLVLATLGVTAERGKVIDFSEYYVSAPGPSVLAPAAFKPATWEELKGLTLCGIQGSYFNKRLGEAYGINLVNFKTQPEAYRALKDNRCVGFAFDDMTLRKKLEDDADWKDYKIAVEPYEYIPQAAGIRKDDAAFLDAVNKAITKAEAEGKLIEWETTYGMPHSKYIAERSKKAAEKLKL
ncbi:transporter substrate-binding domain-containing protein [Ancylobacter pratisalsi]|uniref:Transporter substrate-binding domain-containing protein n=1 Tax=Ancylobacter pratisalsi TaxID=1745854 RepID=A0A6P1YPG6_9HYPH|nr:transporter substrate-binding domain-containing protein [Ancylobacter pratisalsi]QIB34621.1 transporter substrate-binding domain-containing protein [Ancylobacter pratisalsi]